MVFILYEGLGARGTSATGRMSALIFPHSPHGYGRKRTESKYLQSKYLLGLLSGRPLASLSALLSRPSTTTAFFWSGLGAAARRTGVAVTLSTRQTSASKKASRVVDANIVSVDVWRYPLVRAGSMGIGVGVALTGGVGAD